MLKLIFIFLKDLNPGFLILSLLHDARLGNYIVKINFDYAIAKLKKD